MDKIKSPFQYKDITVKKSNDRYCKYLTKKRYRLMGIKKIIEHEEYASFIDRNKQEFVVVKTSLKKQNGTKINAKSY